METKKFGQVTALLVGILMVLGIGIGVACKVTAPAISVSWQDTREVAKKMMVHDTVSAPVVEMVDFVDQEREISFSYPKAFFQQKSIDGKYAYQAYFTSGDIRNDFRQLGDDQVQLTVTVFKKGWIDGKDTQELEKQGAANIEEETSILVDGVSATQERVLFLTDDPGCDVRTYFTKSGVSYEVSMFSPGKNCETVRRFMAEYTAVLSSFRVGEEEKK